MAVRIKVGLIANTEFSEPLELALRDAGSNIDFEVRFYDHQDEAGRLAHELEGIVDAILFSGPVPYYVALAERPLTVPASHVVFDEASLVKAFFDLVRAGVDPATISVDTVSDDVVVDVCRELEIDPSGIRNMPLVDGRIHDDFTGFHIEHYRAGHTRHALTCRSIVKHELAVAGVPCHFMFWTKHTILKALDLLVSNLLQQRYRGSQIAIGLLRVNTPQFNGAIADVRRHALALETYLLAFSDRLGVNLLDIGSGLHLFYTTYGALRRQTEEFTVAPALEPIPLPGFSLQIGIGTGASAAIAEDGARKALHQAEQRNGDGLYIVFDGDRLVGPLGQDRTRLIRVEDAAIVQLAERTGVTAANLARMLETVGDDKSRAYSAVELAAILDSTSRTARRVLTRLTEAGFAVPVGESTPIGHGRPSTLYRIDLTVPGNLSS
ncbi:hypothetical protein ARD30_13200 [Bosea thiooxidans]|uniref:Transcriptional regulator n=1 Tax=Bosea thiooxidans TaxID=53254 RepID=A0A0Q3I663_9HYPH|nr:hypothetical protein [Bosea thiooxidans]KQK30487.1 hypothetical protein ARD30_13200 [Bosea thiooxidans]SKC16315.1 hypothetical protein SAMN05660750_04942 [Bosea thiooxidans]